MSTAELLAYQKMLVDERRASREEHKKVVQGQEKVAEKQDQVVEAMEELIRLGRGGGG